MNPSYTYLSPQKVRTDLEGVSPGKVIDVRNPDEYARRHIPQAVLMPMGEFAERSRTELVPTEKIILICEHGVRSESAAQYLVSLGYKNVSTMTGGMAAYDGAVEGEF